MAFATGYCTVLYANSVNENDTWDNLESSAKELAISVGKNYIDSVYTCADSTEWDITDISTIPEEIQLANAKLANSYADGTLTDDSEDKSGPITYKKVKAGSVETATTYLGFYSQSTGSRDKNKDITLMISAYCTIGNTGNLIRV